MAVSAARAASSARCWARRGVTVLRDQLQDVAAHLVGHTGNYETIVFGAILVLILQDARARDLAADRRTAPPPAIRRKPNATLPTRVMPTPGEPLLRRARWCAGSAASSPSTTWASI